MIRWQAFLKIFVDDLITKIRMLNQIISINHLTYLLVINNIVMVEKSSITFIAIREPIIINFMRWVLVLV